MVDGRGAHSHVGTEGLVIGSGKSAIGSAVRRALAKRKERRALLAHPRELRGAFVLRTGSYHVA